MSSYTGHAWATRNSVRVKSARDARSIIAEAITSLMARDPEAVARDAITVNAGMGHGRGRAHAYRPRHLAA